jgi:hypothetical protein
MGDGVTTLGSRAEKMADPVQGISDIGLHSPATGIESLLTEEDQKNRNSLDLSYLFGVRAPIRRAIASIVDTHRSSTRLDKYHVQAIRHGALMQINIYT